MQAGEIDIYLDRKYLGNFLRNSVFSNCHQPLCSDCQWCIFQNLCQVAYEGFSVVQPVSRRGKMCQANKSCQQLLKDLSTPCSYLH
jgi:hypothetical protein